MLETAIAFYHAVLTQHRLGQPALDYLRGRGFTDETIAKFQLGWAPDGWDTMSDDARSKRRSIRAGGARGGRPRPRRARAAAAASTTASASGSSSRSATRPAARSASAAGILGRRGPDGRDHGPKYLNSPATLLFDKSRTLYLIDRAKGAIRKPARPSSSRATRTP